MWGSISHGRKPPWHSLSKLGLQSSAFNLAPSDHLSFRLLVPPLYSPARAWPPAENSMCIQIAPNLGLIDEVGRLWYFN
ncbi:hypothetical protein M5K25_021520 [Dendrobium thyrsiflorum]|uniref:Uncharacterized protein n=1 Tax=Dendrobium thyrsiflorum TaxID=117978 RepID=A0ABD0UCI1_DENTH